MIGGIEVGLLMAALVGLLAVAVWVVNRRGQRTDPAHGTFAFRHRFLLYWIALFGGIVSPLGVAYLAVYCRPEHEDDVAFVLATSVPFALVSLMLMWEASRFVLVATPEGLYCRSAWRRAHFLRWSEVESLSFSESAWCFVIRAAGPFRFRVQCFIADIDRFLACMEEHLTPADLGRARFGYALVGRRFPDLTPDSPIDLTRWGERGRPPRPEITLPQVPLHDERTTKADESEYRAAE